MIFILVVHLMVCVALITGILMTEGTKGMSAAVGGYRETAGRGARQDKPIDVFLKYMAWAFYILAAANAVFFQRIFL